jgi:Tol biopolymer transport system component
MKQSSVIKIIAGTSLIIMIYGLYVFNISKPINNQTDPIVNKSNSLDGTKGLVATSSNCANRDEESIAFLAGRDLYVMSDEGCNVQLLMKDVSDSPAWSPDGKWIATGCQNDAKLCLIEVSQMSQNHLNSTAASPEAGKGLILPKNCSKRSVRSISWSPDSAHIALVCIAEERATDIYLYNIDEETYRKIFTDTNILRALWSPLDDRILVSTLKGDIYTIDLQGKNSSFVATGWAPDWSADGKKIAFIKPDDRYSNSQEPQEGLALFDLEKRSVEWLYLPSTSSHQSKLVLGCGDLRFDCRLAFSPDNRYLVIGARSGLMFRWDIYRLDTSTGEIKKLTENLNTTQNYEPDWKP